MKRRCTYCREYFDKEQMLGDGVSGVCSKECLRGLQNRAREKRQRRLLHKAMRRETHKQGRRIPGPERAVARRRDGDRCRWCGTTENLNLHHVVYRSEGGPDKAYNLLTLCRHHHDIAHSNKRLYQPVLLHMLRFPSRALVPHVVETITEAERYDAVMWGRNMRHGQVA